MKGFKEKPTASNKTRLFKICRKRSFTIKKADCNHFSIVFSNCINKTKKFSETLKGMTGKRSVKRSLIVSNGSKDIIMFPTFFLDVLNKKFATTVESPTTQELKECFKEKNKNDDTTFAFSINLTEVFNTVGNLDNNIAVGIDGVSAEVLETSLSVIFLIEF